MVLNEGYEGGEIFLSSNHEVKLKARDLLVLPYNFMYPHEVKEVTIGEGFTFVTWAF